MTNKFTVKVVKIESITEIPGALNLEIANIAGWQCVVRKNSHPVGSLAIYIPIDSVLPHEVESKLFGPDSKVKLHKSRVKSIKLRGAVSQGMLAPCEEFNVPAEEGYDCTEELKITKYEPPEAPATMSGGLQVKKLKKNPHFPEYGGLDNFKNYPKLFEEGEQVVITEKIHGTNFRCGWVKAAPDTFFKRVLQFFHLLPKYEFVYGSNRVQLQNKMIHKGYYEKNVYAEAVKNYNLKENMKAFPGTLIYGEIYGDGIQKGYNYGCATGVQKLVAFDVHQEDDQGNKTFLNHAVAKRFIKGLGLDMVPVLYEGPYDAKKAKELTVGNSVLAPTQKVREGVVIRPAEETKVYIGRKVLKLISDEYLLGDQSDFH